MYLTSTFADIGLFGAFVGWRSGLVALDTWSSWATAPPPRCWVPRCPGVIRWAGALKGAPLPTGRLEAPVRASQPRTLAGLPEWAGRLSDRRLWLPVGIVGVVVLGWWATGQGS